MWAWRKPCPHCFLSSSFGYQTANNDLKPNKFYCSYTTNLKL